MSKNICIWHANCLDGFGSATVVKLALNDCDFFEGIYGNPPPDVKDKHVIMVDFSYHREVVEAMLEDCASIIIIDHHKTAIDRLSTLMHPKLTKLFDQKHSGAVLTWKTFFAGKPVPPILQHIQDRDLWRFELPWTREICASLYSHEFDFDQWLKFDIEILRVEGIALCRNQDKRVKQLVGSKERWMVIGGQSVPVRNCGVEYASDVGHALAQGQSFAACYSDTSDSRVFSLRSDDQGMDVALVAEKYEGGGHKHAAGFTVPLTKLVELGLL
jgi:oligoribonuclease NrnB/cAMP/cGMP phosphodiesterase (DHH superfamily)